MESILNSKLRLKAQQVCAVGNAHIKVFPNTNKGSIHDNLLKLKQDLAMVVVKGLSKVNRAVISNPSDMIPSINDHAVVNCAVLDVIALHEYFSITNYTRESVTETWTTTFHNYEVI